MNTIKRIGLLPLFAVLATAGLLAIAVELLLGLLVISIGVICVAIHSLQKKSRWITLLLLSQWKVLMGSPITLKDSSALRKVFK